MIRNHALPAQGIVIWNVSQGLKNGGWAEWAIAHPYFGRIEGAAG